MISRKKGFITKVYNECFRELRVPTPTHTPSKLTKGPLCPSTSGNATRTSRKSWDELTIRAQQKKSLEIRHNYPEGAILKAAEQIYRLEGQNDTAAVVNLMSGDPAIASKARKALKLENPCELPTFDV